MEWCISLTPQNSPTFLTKKLNQIQPMFSSPLPHCPYVAILPLHQLKFPSNLLNLHYAASNDGHIISLAPPAWANMLSKLAWSIGRSIVYGVRLVTIGFHEAKSGAGILFQFVDNRILNHRQSLIFDWSLLLLPFLFIDFWLGMYIEMEGREIKYK